MAIPTPVRLHVGTVIRPTDAPTIRWIAPLSDGLAHAFPGQRFQRAACGGLPVDERFVFAVRSRCTECLVVVGAEQVRTGTEITESEQRLLDGNR